MLEACAPALKTQLKLNRQRNPSGEFYHEVVVTIGWQVFESPEQKIR